MCNINIYLYVYNKINIKTFVFFCFLKGNSIFLGADCPLYDPLSYVLSHPYGTAGFQYFIPKIQKKKNKIYKDKYISFNQYYKYRMFDRIYKKKNIVKDVEIIDTSNLIKAKRIYESKYKKQKKLKPPPKKKEN